MNRRQWIRGAISTIFGGHVIRLVGVVLAVLPEAARAQTAEVVISAVQIGLAFAQLFGSKGPSIVDLLNIQTEMLRSISTQLATIQKSITLLYDSLDELKALVRKLPEATVIELYKTRISGIVQQYDEELQTYALIKSAEGLASAYCKTKAEIENEILIPLRRERSGLFTHKDELTMPIICTALQTEAHAMIMAHYDNPHWTPHLNAYREWISDFLEPKSPRYLGAVISDIEAKLEAAQKDLDRTLGLSVVRCCNDFTTVLDYSTSTQTGEVHGLKSTPILDPSVDEAFRDLADAGEAIPPQIASYRLTKLIEMRRTFSGPIDKNFFGPLWRPCSGSPPIERCKLSVSAAAEATNSQASQILLLRRQYLMYKSIRLSAANALSFIDKLINSAEKIPEEKCS